MAVKAMPGASTPRYDDEIELLLKRAQEREEARAREGIAPINDLGRPLGRAGQSLLLSR